MITLKSRREISLMREAGRLVAEAHAIVRSMIAAGITTGELDAAIERLFDERGAIPLFRGVPGSDGAGPFPAVTCISINEEVVHGIPGSRVLEEGDIVSVDTGCKLNGWCGDAAWTYAVGGVDDEKRRLLEIGEATLATAIRELGRCAHWSEVAAQMEKLVRQAGFSLVRDFVGHGIGQQMHEEPQVPNYPGRSDFKLESGLVLAIEPMVNAGTSEVVIVEDGWTVETRDGAPSVHFEHTVALTVDGPVVLTEGVGAPLPA